ncbi:MAG: DUF547 domain-containing protein [Thermoanaerobaculia bacterium]
MKKSIGSALLVSALLASAALAAGAPDPAPLDAVLAARARNGGFDYQGMTAQDRKRHAAYVANLTEAPVAQMTADERKAFYINAYNALAIQTLLDNPGKKIIDIDGAFKAKKYRVGGEMLTLDEIENELRATGDPRIHFGIVCASKSCPPLAPKAFTAANVDAALDRLGREFVNDPSKNVVDRAAGKVALSKIFFWNRKEFEKDAGSIAKYVSRYVKDPAAAQWLAAYTKEPEFLEYDWSPNQP